MDNKHKEAITIKRLILILLILCAVVGIAAANYGTTGREPTDPGATPLPQADPGASVISSSDSPATMTRESYKILAGTALENEIVVLKGADEGPTIFVVAGFHGQEIAGWAAANRLKEQAELVAGTLYILSPANLWGASNYRRYVTPEGGDLNRSFPGDPQGSDAERIAHAIYSEIQRIEPDIILDLHEGSTLAGEAKSHSVGNSLIYHADVGNVSDFMFEFLLENELGNLCSAPFTLLTPAATGGMNQVVTDTLGIPTITVETFSGAGTVPSGRIADHTDILHFTLRYFGLEAP
jgi:predicted deacylase